MPRRSYVSAALLTLALTATPLPAVDYFWDPGDATGNWQSNNWSLTAAPPYSQAWSDGNTANFSGANQTITVNNFITPAGINFTANGINLVSGTGGTNDLRITGNVPISVSGTNTATISEELVSIGAGSNVTVQGTGTLVLAGANSVTTFQILSGATLQVGNDSALGFAGGVGSMFLDGTLDLNGFSPTRGALAGLGSTGLVTNSSATASTLTIGNSSSSSTFAGVIQNGTGTLGLTKTGTSTLILTGANTYTGATNVNGGLLQIGLGGTAGALPTAAVNIAAGATLRINKSTTETFSAPLTGSGTLGVQGGNISLGANASNFAGLSLVFSNSGLYLGAGYAGSVTVGGGGGSRLGGHGGIIAGAVTVNAGGLLSPGAIGAGTTGGLTFGSGFTLAGHATLPANRATYFVDVQGSAQGAQTNGYDTALVTGGMVNIDGAILDFGTFAGTFAVGDRLTLIDGSGSATVTGTFFDASGNALPNGAQIAELSGLGGQSGWVIVYTGQDVFITPIPEPGSAVCVLAGAALGLGLWKGRRREAGGRQN